MAMEDTGTSVAMVAHRQPRNLWRRLFMQTQNYECGDSFEGIEEITPRGPPCLGVGLDQKRQCSSPCCSNDELVMD